MTEKQKEEELIEEMTDEERIAEALQHYWKEGGDDAMIPSKSNCYVSHGRVYICNSNEILAVYEVNTIAEIS